MDNLLLEHAVEPAPERDHGGGAALQGESENCVRVQDPLLTALDLDDCPSLRSLDLRQVAAGVVVKVSACPSLEEIQLPGAEPGATIHWHGADG
ncbi:hypothetical protein LRF89_13110, partial [Halorhodospira sp. 9621]|uniref:hypothetical protein n=1 Tax=Halorhodospira sp. 9621 TaxID=2899135 RepID=UPI001EE7957E